MLKILIVLAYFSNNTFFDNVLGGGFMAGGFIHSTHTGTSAYDNPALLGVLDNIYAFTTESPHNNKTFYEDSRGRSNMPVQGIISPKIALYYRKIFDINERTDTPYIVNRERYSEYTLGLSSSNTTTSLGINLKYLTALYAYANNTQTESMVLDFAKGVSLDIGLLFNTNVITLSGAYNHVYGVLKWDSGKKTRIPGRHFITAAIHPLKNMLYIMGEYEKHAKDTTCFYKAGITLNIPYSPKDFKTSLSYGYIRSGEGEHLLTYGFSIRKSVAMVKIGFDNKGNIAVTLYTSGM